MAGREAGPGGWRVAVDVGGTFTDVVIAGPAGQYAALKVPSTPPDFDAGVREAVRRAVRTAGREPAELSRVLHATTAGTNAVLGRTGPRTGLVTTRGFGDVLEIGRLRTPGIYELDWHKPPPLVRRRHRVEAAERVAADGSVLEPLDPERLRPAVDALVAEGVTSVAVSFLNSYVNSEHEQRLAAWLEKNYAGLSVSTGSGVVAESGEYERTSTAVLNAYLQPVLSRYVSRLTGALRADGVRAPVFIMQSSGGMMPAAEAADLPVNLVESGPAAGALAAARVVQRAGVRSAISFDMGGTTAKAALVEDFAVAQVDSFVVGGEVSGANRLLRGGGYAVMLPMVDLAEVGAGGGSLAAVDAAGGLSVGPASAGAEPGPACYGRGGTRPTVTDANLLLGYLSEAGLGRGGVRIRPEFAERAVAEHVAGPLGLAVAEAAYAVHTVANHQMARVLRAVSTERGRAVEDYTLVVFGGGGPVHAAALAEAVGIGSVLVPPMAGVLSAAGLLWAPVALTAVETAGLPLDTAAGVPLQARLDRMAEGLRERLATVGFDRDVEVRREIDCCYAGQATELAVDAGTRSLAVHGVAGLAEAFRRLHRDTYGHGGPGAVRAVRLRVTLAVPQPGHLPAGPAGGPPPDADGAEPVPPAGTTRTAWFAGRARQVAVTDRTGLAAAARRGPLLVDDPDTTVVVPPGWSACLDGHGNVRLERDR